MLLHRLTKLTALKLDLVEAAEALQHLGLLTRLQDLSLAVGHEWAAAGCPGLQELKALTRLELLHSFDDIPPSASQLTALQQLDADGRATPTALNKLSVLTGLTYLCVRHLRDMLPNSPPLQPLQPGGQACSTWSCVDWLAPCPCHSWPGARNCGC